MRIDGYCTLGMDREYTLTEADLLRAMDAANVSRAVVAPVDRCLAVKNREGNAAMLRAAAQWPDRFIPSCTVNPWTGSEGLTELRRAAQAGARLLVLEPVVQGFALGDELLWPVLEAASESALPVYVHTGGYQNGAPCQLALCAERFPDTVFIMGHCGSTDYKSDAAAVLGAFPNIYGEVSFTRSMGARSLLDAVGKGRLVMGSAAPRNDLAFEWQQAETLIPYDGNRDFYGATLAAILEGPRHDH